MRDISVEALFPQGRERFDLGIDAVGGPPHRDFADERGVRWLPGAA